MSGFQIPGLGFAKPNETLPPLPPDLAVAAAHSAVPEDSPAKNEPKDEPMTDSNVTETQAQAPGTDAMVVDQPAGSEDLTDALEAAINGLSSTNGQTSQAPSAAPDNQEPPVELQNDQGEHPEWEIDSSPYESSSESSSSDSSDEDSDNEGYELMGVEETARLLMEAEGGSDDEGDKAKGAGAQNLRTKNELPEEVIPRPDVTITPDMKIEELGAIEHIVDTIIVIKAITPGEYQVLDTGSVVCTAERVVIGAVAETIGKVLQPMYTVYFNTPEEIQELGLKVGDKIFYAEQHASYVFTEPLKAVKGSDASNLHDEEVGDEEMEFSDDEKEAEYKRSLKKKKQEKKAGKNAGQPHPLRQEVRPDGGLNYDDEDDGPYKPLARPSNYGEGPVTNETYEPSRNGPQRGRRGDHRGRGGRGRGSGRGGRGGGFGQSRDGYSLPPQGGPAQLPPPATMPNFNFQLPGWPQQPGSASLPGQPAPNGAFVNPAFFAALMSQMQQNAQNGQPQWPGQQPPPPPQGGPGQ
ncbi:Gar1/Naf1 RNA binding region-domain-containing protein [Stachybotrys elegans]|uniref:H/ACA ribonucleoprotein complex non-core subunit NAF1 n=1 Tax=Stachybotrys elegans TaxID=80388 RepID=A0A8K0SNG1_9HYPO|nr:Gar1/Naf1 RNA binding region-domain-containing protein [Stachybotrys elegans]